MEAVLQLSEVSKRYGGVRALERASFACGAGRIHALLGENGAGKSTLIKVMAGVVQPDEGRLLLQGRERRFAHPQEAVAAGIACIFQELSLLPDLSVADNICITNPPRRFGLVDRRAQRRVAEAALARAGAEDIHPLAPVASLPLSRRQLVEIAKALARDPKILILDEATSALTAADVQRVFALLRRLRGEGMAIVYISHRMREIAELADDCSVFRNGTRVATFEAGTRSDAQVLEMMIGRDIAHAFPPKPQPPAATVPAILETRGLGWAGRLHGIDLAVRPGEIVGLGGLDGQGQRELFLALFGVLRGVAGDVRVDGRAVRVRGPRHARALGIALVPEDRKTDGLLLPMSVHDNLSLAALDRLSRAGVLRAKAENEAVAGMVRRLAIKAADPADAVGTLSGGNQQKVVIGKWLLTAPRILLLNDPTRGIDVGTKQEIYALVRALAAEGAAVLLYSTDYAELIGCCDRVAVFYAGRIVRWLEGAALTERALVASALDLQEAA
ncbi:sugar ABC transporter ATP-binding protein [Ramlibacter sp. USB13]|uniref:Sugar ABC transporter ATP-binding protein n=1 Tax=Ramlibacter cellulosilyticus TaxID=2764187 RepID=A0A923MXH8_9BURK|nr:sugar ABC transporter ATP-binding protein [Ramlibacter cellulosilyticus]MBC5785944.1 sugar ABC transporter ATP-binding protein [Ramlibacter cellulosilyticus]